MLYPESMPAKLWEGIEEAEVTDLDTNAVIRRTKRPEKVSASQFRKRAATRSAK